MGFKKVSNSWSDFQDHSRSLILAHSIGHIHNFLLSSIVTTVCDNLVLFPISYNLFARNGKASRDDEHVCTRYLSGECTQNESKFLSTEIFW